MSVFAVPGRANLIGEHTDYNDGLSLPFALEMTVRAMVQPSSDANTHLIARGFGQWSTAEPATEPWQRQAQAVFALTQPPPVTIEVRSDVPVGAGLSSSAAYVSALALASGAHGELFELSRLVQRAEADAGSAVGLLDPLAVLGAHRDHLLLVDFADESVADVGWPPGLFCTAVHSGISRSLAETNYQGRRAECAVARDLLGGWASSTPARVEQITDDTLRRRARHVVSERDRVLDTVKALRRGDVESVGQLVSESHESLSWDFQVSTHEIDDLVRDLCDDAGVYGARLIGGGFGGCVLVVHEQRWTPPPQRPSWALRPTDGALARVTRDT